MCSKISKFILIMMLNCFVQADAAVVYQSKNENGIVTYSNTPTKNSIKMLINDKPLLSPAEEKVKNFIGNDPFLQQQNSANKAKYQQLQKNFINAFVAYQNTLAKIKDPVNAKKLPVLKKQLAQEKIALAQSKIKLDQFKAVLVKPKN